MVCPGNTPDHCCYVAGQRCKYLEEGTVSGRHWACGLRRELGSWNKVHVDVRYLRDVKPAWLASPLKDNDCGDWPPPGVTCPECGEVG